tara:strand:+ start:3431 stop:5683 length:2253 start_codon:yes stop_codon:yes gene_type:complete
MYPEYKSKGITAKTISELARSDGSSAYEINNFDVDEAGYLVNQFRIMPLIPDEWNAAIPAPFSDVRGIAYAYFDGGSRPEILFFTATGVFRYAPWLRVDGAATKKGLEEQVYYRLRGVTASVTPMGRKKYPAQSEKFGERIYFTYGDGGGAWVWDGYRVRRFGFEGVPSTPEAAGPSRSIDSDDVNHPNGGGFSVKGRIGTIDNNLHNIVTDGSDADDNVLDLVVGGLGAGEWQYAVVYENVDGAYSKMSPLGARCSVRQEPATDPSGSNPTYPEMLRRQFWVHSISKGPVGTVARIILRSPDQLHLTTGPDHRPRFLRRISNNVSTEFIDNTPDGELGPIWKDREATPVGVYFLRAHAGSLFQLRTDGNPYRVWWSEQTSLQGATPESTLRGHWIDVFPETGPITGSISVSLKANSSNTPVLLILKEHAVHHISGAYPDWKVGTLHPAAGLAGPSLIQATPDDSVLWYGNNTFWILDTKSGSVVDVGVNIRESLSKVNVGAAGLGVSWVRPDTKEVVFCLPIDDETQPRKCFIWDYRFGGWRTRDNIKIDAAISIPKMGISILAGKIDPPKTGSDITNVWVENRGYPLYTVVQPTATYRSGWVSMTSVPQPDQANPLSVLTATMRGIDKIGSSVHALSNINDLIVVFKEASSGSATVATYQDWDGDTSIDADTLLLAHPEQQPDIPYYGSALYGTGVYRDARVYSERVALGIGSASVFQVKVTSESPMKLLTLDVFGPTVATPGGRTPQ